MEMVAASSTFEAEDLEEKEEEEEDAVVWRGITGLIRLPPLSAIQSWEQEKTH